MADRIRRPILIDPNIFLRIIAGEHRGRQLKGPGRNHKIRPTGDRVRETLFDILARQIKDLNVLDLCAGTGSLGLEALSRGAKSATFVEKNPKNIKLIRENIEQFHVSEKTCVMQAQLPHALRRIKAQFQLIFFDPPYSSDLVDRVIPRLAESKILTQKGTLVVERDRRSPPLHFPEYAINRRHRVGDTELWFLHLLSPKVRGDQEEE